jgi:diacylglycerol kinase (ATP)
MIVNPISGRGAGPSRAAKALERFEAAGVSVEMHVTRGPGSAAEWLGSRCGAYDAAIAVGGDGTLREIIEAVAGTPVTLGIVPVGTANVVARDLGLPRRPELAAGVILQGHRRRIDTGLVNGRRFLAMVGAGLDAEIVRRLSAQRRGPIRMASYLGPTLAALRRWREAPMRLAVDGAWDPEPCFGVIVSNTRNYGGLFSMCPDARLDDGWLDYQARRRGGAVTVARCLLAGTLGRPLGRGVCSYGKGRSFGIDAESPIPVQADGDYIGTTPVEIRLDAGSVAIFAPESNAS